MALEGGDIMKRFKLAYFILATAIFILIFSTLLGTSIISKYSEINGLYKTDKVSAHVREKENIDESNVLTLEDIKHLQRFSFRNLDITYASENKAYVLHENNQVQADVLGVSDKYNLFHQIKLESGSFITRENKNEMVAIVDEDLAMELFNNTQVIGMYIELYNQRFKIIGVVKPDISIVQTLADNGYGNIYIPIEHLLQYAAGSNITSLELRTESKGRIGKNISFMKDALSSIGKNASDYKIIDWNNEKVQVEEKARIGIFIAGVAVIVFLLLYAKKRTAETYRTISSSLKQSYFKDILKQNYVWLIVALIEIITSLSFVFLIWKVISFNVYIKPEYIPEELIDLKFYLELLEGLIQSGVQDVGYVPTSTELKLNLLSVMQTWNLYIFILVGFPLYYLGIKLLELNSEDIIRKIVYCCTFIAFSVVLSLLILNLFKMPIGINTASMLVIFVLIFLSVVKSDHSVKKDN